MSPWKHYGYSLTEGRPSGCYVGRHSQASLQKVSDSYTQQALSLLIVHRCIILGARLDQVRSILPALELLPLDCSRRLLTAA